MKTKPMSDEHYVKVVATLIGECETFRDDRSKDRTRAVEYFDGEMHDIPTEKGRSKVSSRDIAATIDKIIPSVIRTILGGESVVEITPKSKEDEPVAKQATDYFNEIVFAEDEVHDAIHDVCHDALLLRNGILHWYRDYRREPKVSMLTGIPDAEFMDIVNDKDVEVLEHTATETVIEGQPVTLHDARIRRVEENSSIKLCAVPMDEFMIHPDAVCVDEAIACGRYRSLRRSDLVAMGFDPVRVADLPAKGADNTAEALEDDRRDAVNFGGSQNEDKASDEIDYYEMFVRVDRDGDGLAELRRVIFAGGIKLENLFEDEYWDEIPYSDVRAKRKPHSWEGISVYDDLREIQRIKTVLLRATLDNVYWQNKPQPIVQEGSVIDPDAVINPGFGKPIRIRQGMDVNSAITFRPVPFVAADSFAMIAHWDKTITDRTGVSDASSGMAPDALQNMTAKATALIEQAGIGRTEMIVRSMAVGIKRAVDGMLELHAQNPDVAGTVRLRNQYVPIDPRGWNAEMDVTVNVGLGAGTRERDLLALGAVETSMAALATQGPHLGIVTPKNLYDAAIAKAAAAGIRNPEKFFTEPNPEAQLVPPGPSPEEKKLEADIALEREKMSVQRDKEIAQGEADIMVAQRKHEMEAQARAEENAIRMEDIASRERVAMAKLAQDREIELLKLGAVDQGDGIRAREDMRNEMLVESMMALNDAIATIGQPKSRRFVLSRDPVTGEISDISEVNDTMMGQ